VVLSRPPRLYRLQVAEGEARLQEDKQASLYSSRQRALDHHILQEARPSMVPQRSGRPRRTDDRVDRRIVREVEHNRCVSAAVVAAHVAKGIGAPARVWGAGLPGRSAQKKPFLSCRHRRLCAAYGKRFDNMAPEWWC
jgi:hypothetical protein